MAFDDFEEITFRNMVSFNKRDLYRVIRGTPACKVFGVTHIRKLKKVGIIATGRCNKAIGVSDKAIQMLKEMGKRK